MTSVEADQVVGCILAGGRSTRMGHDKAFSKLGGRPLLRRAIDRLGPQVRHLAINTNNASPLHLALGLPLVADTFPGHAGPLAGILAALRYAQSIDGATHVATAAVDVPFFPHDLVSRLSRNLAAPSQVALAASAGRLHPTFGIWPIATADALETWLRATSNRSIRAWAARCAARTVDFPLAGSADPFFNINTRDDLAEAARMLRMGI